MTLEEFRVWAASYAIVPVVREVPFDTNTAVTAYAKIREAPFSFLLESVTGGEKWARYTFLGSAPREVLRITERNVESWTREGGWRHVETDSDPLTYVETRLADAAPAPVAGLPRFFGG